MSLFHDLITCELCFPGATNGATNGATEINCPHCSELPTVSVNDPMGEEVYQCRRAFEVDWGEGQVRYSVE